MSYVASVEGTHFVSVTLNGVDIQGSPLEINVSSISAKRSYIEAPPFVTVNQPQEIEITTFDEDDYPLAHGGGKFTSSMTINNKPQVCFAFLPSSFSFIDLLHLR